MVVVLVVLENATHAMVQDLALEHHWHLPVLGDVVAVKHPWSASSATHGVPVEQPCSLSVVVAVDQP